MPCASRQVHAAYIQRLQEVDGCVQVHSRPDRSHKYHRPHCDRYHQAPPRQKDGSRSLSLSAAEASAWCRRSADAMKTQYSQP